MYNASWKRLFYLSYITTKALLRIYDVGKWKTNSHTFAQKLIEQNWVYKDYLLTNCYID